MVDASIAALLAFAGDDFSEATHVMSFPRVQGFRGEPEVHAGSVFARALICEALSSVADRAAQVEPVVERTLSQVLHLQRGDGSGWAYFPQLPELPSDVDDLAAVIRAVVRARGKAAAAALTYEPLSAWLAAVPPDGRCSTWIASRDADLRTLQRAWIDAAWGDTYDPEVAAHMVLAIHELGGTGAAFAAVDAVRRAITDTQIDGLWPSTWYWGPYYGTMVAAGALATVTGYETHLSRALDALAAHRRNDGGWGVEGCSDQLNTAFALLALAAIATRASRREAAALACTAMPTLARLAREAAAPTPFIRMEVGRVGRGVAHTLSYASAAITAAFTLKAALAWEHASAIE